jgi:hypothetical protein
VTLDSATFDLASYTQNGGTLFFTNWATCLRAAQVLINSGKLDHAVCDTNAVPGNTNRVYIAASNVTIEAGGQINVSQRGFPGAAATNAYGQGPGGAFGNANDQGGGGHGGVGGTAGSVAGGMTNDLANAPTLPGSGGGRDFSGLSGTGGGVVRIAAIGRVTVNGTIAADGKNMGSGDGGGGAGGSIWISCDTFAGTGLLNAAGGTGSSYRGGGGGGGRIAVTYDPARQAASGLSPMVQFSIGGGSGGSPTVKAGAQAGTLYLEDAQFLPSHWPGGAVLCFGTGVTSLAKSYADMRFDNGYVEYPAMPINFTVSGNVTVNGVFNRDPFPDGARFGSNATLTVGGSLTVSNGFLVVGTNLAVTGAVLLQDSATVSLRSLPTAPAVVTCRGDLTMTTNIRFYVYATETNAVAPAWGARIDVAGKMAVGPSNCWVYPSVVNSVNASNTLGAALFRVGSLIVTSNSGFNANYAGYAGGKTNWFFHGLGPGGGYQGSISAGGGGHGGTGGLCLAAGPYGLPYGSATNANTYGSGGSMSGNSVRWPFAAGAGGGVIWIQSAGDVIMDGALKADGQSIVTYNGPGAGGGILVQAAGDFSGAPGALISAQGGDGMTYNTGGGGGGRVAIWRRVPPSLRDQIACGGPVQDQYAVTNAIPEFKGDVWARGGTGTVFGTSGTVLFLTGVPLARGIVVTIR